MHVEGGLLVPMQKKETMEVNDSGCVCCDSINSTEMQVSVNGKDCLGVVCNECGETYVYPDSQDNYDYPDSPGKHYVDGYDYTDGRDYSLFTGKPTNREFKKFRDGKSKRREKSNKPQRGGVREYTDE